MKTETAVKCLEILRKEYPEWTEPVITEMSRKKPDPFMVLIGTIISQRTKDEVTGEAVKRLFAEAGTPQEMVKLTEKKIEKLIYPAGFSPKKAVYIRQCCRELINRFDGKTPDTIDDLVSLPGVGRKTANLVLTKGYNRPGICVDTHVHRISNRWGYVRTKSPDDTERALRKKLPAEWWIAINDILVAFGKHMCAPVSPKCSLCSVSHLCERKGVKKSR